jgi:hypothetical protein
MSLQSEHGMKTMNTLDKLTKPLAITMWDSSWIRRHYRGGGFEDWDKALSELVARGYNAVRLDVFPHLIAPAPDGTLVEVFKDVPNQFPQFYGFGMWGNPWTMYINPRKSLIEFMTKCREYGVKVGLSTWFKPTDDGRNAQIEGLDEFVRIWDQTLQFIDDNGLMDTVIYLDVLNEFPQANCFLWLHKMAATMGYPKAKPGDLYNEKQKQFLWGFMSDALARLRAKWPGLSMGTSISGLKHMYDAMQYMDMDQMDFLDIHIWLNCCPEFSRDTEYHIISKHGNPHHLFTIERGGISSYVPTDRIIPQDYRYDEVWAGLKTKWESDIPQWTKFFSDFMDEVVAAAQKHNCHVGQTEGWGFTNWTDHPLLEWDVHFGTADICAKLGAEKGYLFNCSANFCHPHFLGFWEPVDWHKQFTETVKSGKLLQIQTA